MSFVYAIGARDDHRRVLPIKIGQSINPEARCKSLQSGSPLPLSILALWRPVSGAHAASIEQSLHRRFSDKNVYGEWFFVTIDEVDDYLSRRVVGEKGSFGAGIKVERLQGFDVEPIRLPFNKSLLSASRPYDVEDIQRLVPEKPDWRARAKSVKRTDAGDICRRIMSNKDSPVMRAILAKREPEKSPA